MGKRSNFERIEKDKYVTPIEGVKPLVPFLDGIDWYFEPCAGDFSLVNHISLLTNNKTKCMWASDIEPRHETVIPANALELKVQGQVAKAFITNPPWSRDILHPLIEHLSSQLPTWLLFDSDWAYTKQSRELIKHCRKIVAIGRLKWFPNSTMTGKDNCSWYLFTNEVGITKFYGRTE